jgi:phage/plasmid-like protein (TIGR03299 family)
MAHNVESMMYAGEAPWHGLGTRVPQAVTSGEALRVAALDWRVAVAPIKAESQSDLVGVEGWKAVIRLSDLKALGVVGERYRPIQNGEAFSFFDELVGEGQAIYHTAGSLDGGRRVWILAKLPGEVVVTRDDVTEKFLLLTNSHDGTTSLRMFFTPVRVVCQNTLNLALSQSVGEGIAIRHTSSAMARLQQAREALGIANRFYDEFAGQAEQLVRASFNDAQMKTLVETVLPGTDGEVSTRTLHARAKVVELFEYGRGHDPIRGTAWAALNAVAEFADHHRSSRGVDEHSRAEARLNSAWFGSGAALKRFAYGTILQQLAA